VDRLSKDERSELMRRVRAKGNRSTEVKVRLALVRRGIKGWKLHDHSIVGRPDLWFPLRKLAIFIDGCFWHGCSRCKRPLPETNREYWTRKIRSNVRRARDVNRLLQKENIKVIRIWEHSLQVPGHLDKLLAKLFPS
jgi:DNA mismatch endonuclease (patch repair protein)